MKTEIHIWAGLPPAVYVRFNIFPAMRKALSINFKSANDEKADPAAPSGDFSRGQLLESTKPKLKVIE